MLVLSPIAGTHHPAFPVRLVERGDDFVARPESHLLTGPPGPPDEGAGMQIILSDFMSLDGVVQAPGDREEDTDGGFAHGGWRCCTSTPTPWLGDRRGHGNNGGAAVRPAHLADAATAWPGRADDPFADRMNEIPKYVASRTLTRDDLTWSGSTLLPADDAIGAVRELRAREGKTLQVMGSASPAAQLIEHDLVDEYRLRSQAMTGPPRHRGRASEPWQTGRRNCNMQVYDGI